MKPEDKTVDMTRQFAEKIEQRGLVPAKLPVVVQKPKSEPKTSNKKSK